jgi:DNA-binding response OmpR family regulator
MRGDHEIELKPLEFDVLVMLLRSKNRTVPRERLLNEIWGPDYFGGPRTVDVHVANIRKKLGSTVEINSISKVGYRLEE